MNLQPNGNWTEARFLESLEQMRLGSIGSGRAPHKPVVVLVALARQTKCLPRLMSFVEARDSSEPAIRLFAGPSVGNVDPAQPFWLLQGEDFWEVIAVPPGRLLPTFPSDAPSGSALETAGASAGLKAEVHDLLSRTDGLAARAAQLLAKKYFGDRAAEALAATGHVAAGPSLDLSRVWWVNQGQSYPPERKDSYVWAPKTDKRGRPLQHHTNVSLLRPGDAVVHYVDSEIRAISLVTEPPTNRDRPVGLPGGMWNTDGHYCSVRYFDLAAPIRSDEIADRKSTDGPFGSTGKVNQVYLVRLTPDFATRLVDMFPERWPEGSPFRTGAKKSKANPWDEFIHWAAKLYDGERFDTAERNDQLEIGQRVTEAAELLEAGSQEWVEKLRRSFGGPGHLTSAFSHGSFLRWVAEHPDVAASTIRPVWDYEIATYEGVDRFLEALPKEAVAEPDDRAAIASLLAMAYGATDWPIYLGAPFNAAYALVGDPGPSPATDVAKRALNHAWTFLERFIAEAAARDLQLRDNLDAQSLVWAITKGGPPNHWSAVDKAAFRLYTGATVSQFDALAQRLLLPVGFFERVHDLLTDHKKHQVVFYGPPGTGKTYVARELAKELAGQNGTVRLVQFHPSYAYEDFVEGYRPRLVNTQPGFVLVDGPLKLAAAAATAVPDARHFLVIDELNRANVAKVLGELYFLLEYRDEKIRLQYSDEEFQLPSNLFIIATMNTADRSIALVDAALRRRFNFVGFFPDTEPIDGLLRRWLAEHRPEMAWVADLVAQANSQLPDRHLAIGPSHFLRTDLDEGRLEMVWKHSVIPYLEEQFLGNEAALADFQLDLLRGRLGEASEGETDG